MATVTSTPSNVSIKFSNRNSTSASGTISWNSPSIPSGATVTSCVLTGTITPTSKITSATVGGKTISTSGTFSVNLGSSITTSARVSLAKSKGSTCTVSFSNLVYTVTYTEPVTKPTYTVTFKDWDGTTLKTQTVEEGSSATAPSNPSRNGYNFTGWDKSFNNITANITITAQYSIKTYTVVFKDWNGTTLKTETVNHGSNATAPANPTRNGYTFIGWDKSFTNITSNLTVTAQYEQDSSTELLNTVIINSNENWGYVKNLTTNEIHTGTNIVITGPNTEDIDLMIYPNEGYHIASVNDGSSFGEDVGPFTQYPCGLAASIGSNTQTYTYVVTYAKNNDSGSGESPADKNRLIFTSNIDAGYVVLNGQNYTGTNIIVDLDLGEDIIVEVHANDGYIIDTVIDPISGSTETVLGPSWIPSEIGGNLFNEKWPDLNYIITYKEAEGGEVSIPEDHNAVIITCNEDWGYVVDRETGETYTGTNIVIAKHILSEIKIAIYPNEGYTIQKIIENDGFTETGPMDNFITDYSPSIGFDTIIYKLQVTYEKLEEEEPDLTEPVDGYIAKNLVSYGDWSYTFNVDWDTQYLDIEVLGYEIGVFAIDYYYNIKNNSYEEDYTHESANGFTIHDVEVESLLEDIDIIRYSKVDGVCIITSNETQIIPGNSFANDTKITIEADVSTELLGLDDGFMTFNIKITDITSSEEPEESKTQNLIIGDKIINELYIGEQEIKEIYLGDNLLFKK